MLISLALRVSELWRPATKYQESLCEIFSRVYILIMSYDTIYTGSVTCLDIEHVTNSWLLIIIATLFSNTGLILHCTRVVVLCDAVLLSIDLWEIMSCNCVERASLFRIVYVAAAIRKYLRRKREVENMSRTRARSKNKKARERGLQSWAKFRIGQNRHGKRSISCF